jgi:hypothetical protein
MDEKLKDQDVLLVREKGSDELKAVKMDKDGQLKQVNPTDDGENPDFLRIDKQGDFLENFFKNFMRQVKDPTRFEFFRVPAEKFKEMVEKLQQAFKRPDQPENKQFLDLHRIDPEAFLKKYGQGASQEQAQGQPPTSEKTYAINPQQVQWDKLEKFGISRETLEKTGTTRDGFTNLDRILSFQKTDLVAVAVKIDDETTLRTDARLSLRRQDDGRFVPALHPIRHRPDLESPYFGVKFTEEDKQSLRTTGHLGRVIEPTFPSGQAPVLLSIDRQTNELVAFRTDRLKIPEQIKGVALNEQQKKELSEGKAVYLENMLSRKGTIYSASVQFDADRRGFMPWFDNEKRQSRSQAQDDGQEEVQKTFRGKKLTDGQRDSLREGKTIYVDGLVDKKGKKYSGYVTLNGETGKTDFMFSKQYQEALAAGRVIADDRHRTQVAVNSEGKTSEATKNVKEPLKKGQTKPDEKQAEKQKQEQPKKSKGRKM